VSVTAAATISLGAQARIPHLAIRPLRTTPGEATAGEAAIAAAVAINDPPWRAAFQAAQAVVGGILDSFQSVPGVSLESLEKTVFPFASRGALEYLMGFTSRTGPPV
jgi:hypothetical protein